MAAGILALLALSGFGLWLTAASSFPVAGILPLGTLVALLLIATGYARLVRALQIAMRAAAPAKAMAQVPAGDCGSPGDDLCNPLQQERIAMAGVIAASLIDSLSQPLSIVASHAEASARWLDRPSPEWGEMRASVGEIADASRNMSTLIRRGREFLRPCGSPFEAVDIEAMLEGAFALLEREFALGRITPQLIVETNLPAITCDAAAIKQVVISLMLNGIEVIRAKGAAQRTLRLAGSNFDDRHIGISITDTGFGTRRDAPEIAICREVVLAHGGALQRRRIPGGGTTFTFTLPVVPATGSPTGDESRRTRSSGEKL